MSAGPPQPPAVMRVPAGQTLFREGERSRVIYRLLAGEAEVTRQSPNGLLHVGRASAGDYLGEIGVLAATRRSATARISANAEVDVLSRQRFLQAAAADADTGQRLLHVLSLRTRTLIDRIGGADERPHGLAGAGRSVFENLRAWLVPRRTDTKARAALLSRDLPRRTIRRGEVLFELGDASALVYWIESGRLRVVRADGSARRTIGHARPGEFLGEMGVLESMARTATAVAASNVMVRELSPAAFMLLMRTSPAAYVSVVESLGERARRLHALASRRIGAEPSVAGGFFETLRSIESIGELAERRVIEEVRRTRLFFEVQVERGRFVAATYRRYVGGLATPDEMARANSYFRDYVKLAGLGTLFMLPGGTVTVPLAAKIGEALGVDVFPSPID